MSTTQRITSELAQTASANIQDDMVRLQDPRAWTKIQKFKDADGVIIRDYVAKGTDVSARVRERNGKIVDVALMTHDTLNKLRQKEAHVAGRLWAEGQTSDTSRATVRGHEFAFGMSKIQEAGAPCILITPATYFQRTGETWPHDTPLHDLLPSWLKKKTPGVYQTDGRDYESVAGALLDSGFIELDALSSYHQTQILQAMNASPDGSDI